MSPLSELVNSSSELARIISVGCNRCFVSKEFRLEFVESDNVLKR